MGWRVSSLSICQNYKTHPQRRIIMNYYKSTDSDSQNLLSGHFATSDGHGGRGTQHREEMKTIAREVFKEEREAMM